MAKSIIINGCPNCGMPLMKLISGNKVEYKCSHCYKEFNEHEMSEWALNGRLPYGHEYKRKGQLYPQLGQAPHEIDKREEEYGIGMVDYIKRMPGDSITGNYRPLKGVKNSNLVFDMNQMMDYRLRISIWKAIKNYFHKILQKRREKKYLKNITRKIEKADPMRGMILSDTLENSKHKDIMILMDEIKKLKKEMEDLKSPVEIDLLDEAMNDWKNKGGKKKK